jgi:hypothetical protein
MKAILFSFMVLIFISCSSKHKIPDGILGPPKMQAILWDILRADEFVLNYTRHDSSASLKDKSTRLYSEVFKIHNITRSQFEKSIDFYNLHPDLFKIVIDSLEKKKTDLNSQLPSHTLIADSLRKKIKPSAVHH